MAKAKKKKSKRKAPHLKVWAKCWKEIGVCPAHGKVSQKDKDRARACVERKMGKKAKRA